jgi:peptidyl-prolyl cis-trans isomerase SurA
MMQRALTLIALILGLLTASVAAQADLGQYKIVAVVDDTPISSLDLIDRAQLMIGTSGLSPTPEVQQRILPQALKMLVEESLQKQEAGRRDIRVTQSELEQAIRAIEQQNGRPPGSLQRYIESKGMPWKAFLQQTEAQLIWNKLLTKVIRPQVRIGEAEMEVAAKNRRFQQFSEEYNITPLVLPVDEPGREEEVAALAAKLVSEIQAGAQMDQIVRQFGGATAGQEPNFWVGINQLDPALKQAVLSMKGKNGLVGPVRTPRGYNILRVNDRRTRSAVSAEDYSEVVIKEVLLPLEPQATPREVRYSLEIANHAVKNPGKCASKGFAGFEELERNDIEVRFFRTQVRALPEFVKEELANLGVGEVGEPFATPEGIRLYMLCERVAMPMQTQPDEKLRETLFREKMELEATKFMRNLRRNQFVEVRGLR